MTIESSGRGPGRPAVNRNKALTLEAVLDQADAIVRERGLDGLTMRGLADELGVTVKAVYNHAASKSAVLLGLVERVWAEIFGGVPASDDFFEWLIQFALRVRSVWLENRDLAILGMAVNEPEVMVFWAAASAEAAVEAGFADIGLAYNVMQTYTFGSIALATTRRSASRYFGRVPEANVSAALRMAEGAGLPAAALDIIEAQSDDGDAKHFETGLRTIMNALRDRPADDASRTTTL